MPRPVTISESPRAFKTYYQRKSSADRGRVDIALQRMSADLSHPSLRARAMAGAHGIWEARASDAIRITFEFTGANEIRLRKCCSHQIYRRP